MCHHRCHCVKSIDNLSPLQEFSVCGVLCGHPSHMEATGSPSLCTQPLWHISADHTSHKGPGQVSIDGHIYGCSHPGSSTNGLHHAILVLDESASMRGAPWSNLVAAVLAFLDDRLSFGGQDLVTIIQHDHTSRIICEAIDVRQARGILLNMRGGGNHFAYALRTSMEVLYRSFASRPLYKPVLLFMSDGGCNYGDTEMQAIGAMGKVQVYTIGFGAGCNFAKMKRLAQLGRGTCLESVTGIELKEAFMAVSSRMGTRVSLVAQQVGHYRYTRRMVDRLSSHF